MAIVAIGRLMPVGSIVNSKAQCRSRQTAFSFLTQPKVHVSMSHLGLEWANVLLVERHELIRPPITGPIVATGIVEHVIRAMFSPITRAHPLKCNASIAFYPFCLPFPCQPVFLLDPRRLNWCIIGNTISAINIIVVFIYS